MDEDKFRVEFLAEAVDFIDKLEEKARDKVLYNIWKAKKTNDHKLFKEN